METFASAAVDSLEKATAKDVWRVDREAEIRLVKKELGDLIQQQRDLMSNARFGGMDATESAKYEDLQNRIQKLIEQLADLEQSSEHTA